MAELPSDIDVVDLATELTIAWLANPNTRAGADDVPQFLQRMHEALGSLRAPEPVQEEPAATAAIPAVSVRKSLASPDHIISMIDGKAYKTLRRHLARHGLTPEQYRERFGLRPDYPMVSKNYSQTRRDMAKQIGLGRKAAARIERAPEASESEPPKAPRGRRRKSGAEAA